MEMTSSSGRGHHTARLNRLIQLALVSGLSVSMLLMITGTILYVLHNPGNGPTSIAPGLLLPGIAASPMGKADSGAPGPVTEKGYGNANALTPRNASEGPPMGLPARKNRDPGSIGAPAY